MLKKQPLKYIIIVCLILGLATILLSQTLPIIAAETTQATARQQVAQAIAQAGESGQYHYQTTIVQTHNPTLLLENVGRSARVETIELDGEVDVPADRMTLQLRAANNPELQIKIENGIGYGRLSEDDSWTEVDMATDLFAPGGDPMGFLASAENMRIVDAPIANNAFPAELLPVSLTSNITRYQFSVDGKKYATTLRDQLEDQLIHTEELPANITLQLAQHYVDMTGSGEIWIYRGADGRELPIRQIVHLDFPAKEGASEWVSAEITTSFSDWSESSQETFANTWRENPRGAATTLVNAIATGLPEVLRQASLSIGITLLLFVGAAMFIAHGQRREVRVAINLTLVVSMLAAPLLQSQQASAYSEQISTFNEQQLVRQTDLEQTQQSQTQDSAATVPALQAQATATALSSSCVITATSDCDGDGLTDNVERYELGTNIEKVDTDDDGISDGREVTPYNWFGDWYLDPLNPDSNGDGLSDGAECSTRSDVSNGVLVDTLEMPCTDLDFDQIPDVHDYDNDGDGVPDSIDLNPNASQVVTDNSVFNFDMVNAQTEKDIVVDLQIRPLDDQHLWWSNSILDWPDDDNQGQHQRMTPNTLGNGDGDIQLLPMLQITIPYSPTNPSGGLPVSGTPVITATTPITTWLDTTTTDKYAMSARLGENGERLVTLPLIEVTDPTGGGSVGWQARIPYRLQATATEWGNAHEMRVIWFVNGQSDSCTPPENASNDYCNDKDNWISTTTLLQTYPEMFRITGLTVSEHHGATALLAGQTPGSGSAYYDNELWHLADVMQKTWLRGDTFSSQRFPLRDVDTTLGQWGITNVQTSESDNLTDEVALFTAVDITAVDTFIDTNLYPVAPISGTATTVLMAGEESYRTVYLGTVEQVDINSVPTIVNRTTYTNSVMTVDFTGKSVSTDGMIRWQPYEFDGAAWQPTDLGTQVDLLETKFWSVFTDPVLANYQLIQATAPGTQFDPAYDDERAGSILLGQNFYLAMAAGVNAPLRNPAPVEIDNAKYPLPTEPVAATINAVANKVKNTFIVLNLNEQTFPTVDASVDAQTAAAWSELASSITTVVKAYGQLAVGRNASAISQALTELSYLPRISIEQGTFDYLTDASLIFANENTRAQLGGNGLGTFKSVLATTYPLATGAVATYGHIWYTQQAGITQLRSAVMISQAGRDTLQRITQIENLMVQLNDDMIEIQNEIDLMVARKELDVSGIKQINFSNRQKGRRAINFYLQDDFIASSQAAEALGFRRDGQAGQLPIDLFDKYTQLEGGLDTLDGYLDQTIDALDVERAKLQNSFGVNPDHLTPEHTLKVKRTAVKWGVAGMVVSSGTSALTIGIALANGRFQVDSPQFSRFLAEQIAGVLIDVFFVILDILIVMGNVTGLGTILTVLAIVDAVIGAVCAATNFAEYDPVAASWICGGISGALAKALSYVINDTTPLVDLDRDDRLEISIGTPVLGDETGIEGMIVGNSITLVGNVTTTLYMDDPNWLGYFYWWQWADNFLDDAAFAYQFQPSQQNIPLDLESTSWNPVLGKNPSSISANDARFYKQQPVQTYSNTFAQAGINKGLPVYFAEGFAVQQQNCWLVITAPVCFLTKYSDTTHQPLENTFIFDVWPASIDELRALTLQPDNNGANGYRLAWDTQFPTLADADGDGLRSQAMNGPDPDDSNADSDSDGLTDGFELATAGFDPAKSDSDCDGLTDYWELFYGTNPALPDTDGDGLTDNQEHFHLNEIYPYDGGNLENGNAPLCSTEKTYYTGGWMVVYDYDSNGNPLLSLVSADPLDPDSDDDTLSDKQERIYAYNPNVASTLNVLSLDATIESDSGQLPYVSPGSIISYTAVVTNELEFPYARGLVEAELPLDNVLRFEATEAIAPRSSVTVNGSMGLAEANLNTTGPVNMGIRAGAKLDDPTGRALWLHMNELAGSTTFADVSFLQNNGTCSGVNCPTADSQRLTFNGNDAVAVPDSNTLDLDRYTIALAVKPTASGSVSTLIGKGTTADNHNFQLILTADNKVVFVTDDTCGSTTPTVGIESATLPLNAWSHVAATYDGSIKTLYINGVPVNNTAYSGISCQNNAPITVGASDSIGTAGFVGQLNELQIYPTALNAATILDRYATPLLLVDMRDSNSWGSDDVSCSGAACPSTNAGGATFDQVNHLAVTAPDLSGDAFTFATWIRPNTRTYPFSSVSATAHGKWTDADYQGIFGYRATTTSNEIFPSLFLGDNGRLRMIWGDGTTTCEVASANTDVLSFDNSWQHITASYDGSNLTFYLNGEPIIGGTTGTCANVTPPNVSSFYIGRPNDFGYLYFDEMSFINFGDAAGIGSNAEMRLNLNSDTSSGNLAWANLDENLNSWTLGKTAVINDTNSWFRVWDNRDGGCFISCPEDSSTDTNFDQDVGKKDTSITQITGINSASHLGEQNDTVSLPACGSLCVPEIIGSMTWSNYNDFFKGGLDDFRVYGYALSDAAVAGLFRSTSTALDLPFDEAPGSSLFEDMSGNAFTVSCSGSTCPTSGIPGRSNQALQFDGVNDFLTIGTSANELGTTEGAFSVMMWVKPDTFWGTNDSGVLPLVEVGRNYELSLSGYGRPTANYQGFTDMANSSLYNATGRWYHLAYVYENNDFTFYVNGVLKESEGYPKPILNTNTLRIGKNRFNAYFDGTLDDLTIVKRALTSDEVQDHLNRAPAINLHLDEGLQTSMGVVIDQSIRPFEDDSENRYVATCADVDTCPDAGDKGQVREAVTFDGNDALSLGDTSNLSLTDFSVGMWVKPTKTYTETQYLMHTGNAFGGTMRFTLPSNSLTPRLESQQGCVGANGTWDVVNASNALLANQWNHIVAVRDTTKSVITLYTNGYLAGTTSSIGAVAACDAPITLGTNYHGGMDEVSITPSALNAAEISDLYNYQAAWYDVINQYSLYVDADLPIVDLSKTPATVSTANTVFYIGADDATSPITTVEYRINGGSWQQATSRNRQAANSAAWTYYFQEAAGTHTVEARATDVVGNVSVIVSAMVAVDVQAPTITIGNSSNVAQVSDSLLLIGTVADSVSGVPANGVNVQTVDWRNAAVGGNLAAIIDQAGNWQTTQPFDSSPYGSYTVTATARDEVGNSATTTQSITLDGLPPYADVTDDENFIAPGVMKTLTGVVGEIPYPADGRTLHLHFESGDGLWVDGSKTKYSMICSGATCPTSGVAGKRGESITFDGVDDRLTFGGNETITTSVAAGQLGLLDGSFTIMGWVNGEDWSGDHAVLGSTPLTTTEGFYAGIQNGRPILGYGGDDTVMTAPIATSEWVHVTWRFDAVTGERTFLINGVLSSDESVGGHSPFTKEDIIEVGRARGGNAFSGSLDELVVYGKALNDETIYDIANPVNATITALQLRVRSYDQRDIGQFAGTWTPVTLNSSNALYTVWQHTLPMLTEDSYKIDLMVTDSSDNTSFVAGAWNVAVTPPNLAVAKQTDATLVELNDTIAYTIIYTNTGKTNAPNTVLTEIVPADTTFNAALSHAAWNCLPDGSAGNQCTLPLGDLSGDSGGSVSFTVTVTDTWSPGTTVIANTASIASAVSDANSADNDTIVQTPINGGIDLAVSIVDDGTALQYDASGAGVPPMIYTISYTNTGTQAASGFITVTWTSGGDRDISNIDFGWDCSVDPYTLEGANSCRRDVGNVAIGQSDFVTFTMNASYWIPDDGVVTTTVTIADSAGGVEVNTLNNTNSAVTPIEFDYAIAISHTAITIQEGDIVTNSGFLDGADPEIDFMDVWDLSVGEFYGFDITAYPSDLDWGWVYTSTDGPDNTQVVTWTIAVGEGGLFLNTAFLLTVENVAPTLPITGNETVASGVQYDITLGSITDPGNDTVTVCSVDWGDGSSDSCPNDPSGHVASHTYGTNYGNPTITIYLTDEDGEHVAATKAITITGITTNLTVDQNAIISYESITATNSGIYSPADASLIWSSSEGNVIDEGNGVWSWSLPPGSTEGSRTVTINAGGQQTTFIVNVQGDGAATVLEDGAPNSGDGNNDGTPDGAQIHVASLPSPLTGQYVTIAATPGMTLTNVAIPATPAVGEDSLPVNAIFPLGFPTFNLTGMGVGGSTEVTIYLTSTTGIDSYYKYDASNGWYEFLYDTVTHTGAEVLADRITLYLVDGGRGDNDLTVNGTVTDPGGPVFNIPSYDLIVNTVGSGSVSIPSGVYPAGTILNPVVTEVPGWSFDKWQGALSGSQISETLTMDQDQTVTAVFVANEYMLDVRTIGNGNISSMPLQSTYTYSDVVALSATADTGWSFSDWSGDLIGTNATTNVSIDGNKVITGTFTQDAYTLTTNTNGSGSVIVSPDQASYTYGDIVSVQAASDPGYALQTWSGDLSGSGVGQTMIIDSNKSITALFVTANYSLTTSTEGSGSILVDPVQTTYNYGDSITVTAIPAQDWELSHWNDGLSGITATQSLTITGNTSLQAIFEPVTYALNVGWIGSGSVQVLSDNTTFIAGETVTVTAVTGVGHIFTGWREQSVDTFFSTSLTTTVMMTETKNIVAVFTPLTYTLDINMGGTGSGSVDISLVDITCQADCSIVVSYGSVISMTATANADSVFTGWSGSGDCSGLGDCVVTIDGAASVDATFTLISPDSHLLSVTLDGNGSGSVTSGGINCTNDVSSDCVEIYTEGTVVTLTATANTGSIFTGWSDDCTNSSGDCVVTMTGAKSVTAIFTKDEYLIYLPIIEK